MAGNRCPDCNKWVSLETDEPQMDSIDVNPHGDVTAEITIARNCGDCGTELKSGNFFSETSVDEEWLKEHDPDAGDHGEYEVSEDEIELTESGGGRYKKNMIGFTMTATVTCKCGATSEVTLEDQMSASAFDEV